MIEVGLEVLANEPLPLLENASIGLLMNQASVDRHFEYAHVVLAKKFPGQLKAIFSPQHGLWSEQQDNMIETPHSIDPLTKVPIHSLYSSTRVPTPEMLQGIDILVVDLQDVGTRVYTYIWTVSHCLETCSRLGIPVVILDRPNPIGGIKTEGPVLRSGFTSFVGRAAVPMRHGLTMGELVRVVNQLMGIGAEIHVVPIRGWNRRMCFPECGRTWVPPSPNLPRFEGTLVYPGQVLLEGTNLSEGRGTTTPFEICGAPFINPFELVDALAAFDLPGVKLRPIRFEPTFQKYRGTSCGGVFVHVSDRETFRPYRTTVAMLSCIRRLWPDEFAWLQPPYEYETEKIPIDILAGSDDLRHAVDSGGLRTGRDLDRLCEEDSPDWRLLASDHMLYG